MRPRRRISVVGASQRAGSHASLGLMYRRLARAFGPQHWWPATSAYEMMVGAILTQATNWRNVERTIDRLRRAKALSPNGLLATPTVRLEQLVRPVGYFRQKAQYLKRFSRWYVARYQGRARRMFAAPWASLRQELLELHGIGPETADSMLLYAGGQPVFVVDAYTMRVLRRHRLISWRASYAQVQRMVMDEWPRAVRRYNEFHALLVAVGKRYCHRRRPDCAHCPLGDLPRTL